MNTIFKLISSSIFLFIIIFFAGCGGGGGTEEPINSSPEITLTGLSQVASEVGKDYTDEGATATDAEDGDLTQKIIVDSDVDTSMPGTYSITYNVSDSTGAAARTIARMVVVVENVADATEVIDIIEVDGLIEATLLNGEKVLLDSFDEWRELDTQFPITAEQEIGMDNLDEFFADKIGMNSKFEVKNAHWVAPSSFSLASDQTNFKKQLSRNTCVSFAVVAALEAAYKRQFDLELDLSEQFVNHMQKNVSIIRDNPQVPYRENQLGFWAGSSVSYLLHLLHAGYRVPTEESHKYVGLANFGNTRQDGDNPLMNFRNDNILQKDVNDINLSAHEVNYNIPSDFEHIALPINASYRAKYGIESYARVIPGELNNLEIYKELISRSYELIVQVRLATDPTPGNGIMDPSENLTSSHGVVFIGYDDEERIFLVKNSWSSTDFEKWSYDWVTEGLVSDASFINRIKEDYESPDSNDMPQRFIGRWHINMDGLRGELDITRLPGSYQSLNGRDDNRIGAYYAEDGSVYRVNGQFFGDRFRFYFDENEPNLDYEGLQGHRFDAYFRYFSIFAERDHYHIAGTMLDADDGEVYGFYATRLDEFAGSRDEYYSNTAGESPLSAESYIGTWLIGDSRAKFHSVDNDLGIVYGKVSNFTYEEEVSAVLSEGNRRITFNVNEDVFDYQNFTGYLFTKELGIFSGELVQKPTDSEEVTRGFIAIRQSNSLPDLTVTSPSNGASIPRGSQNVEFRAEVSDIDGETVTIVWTSDLDGEIGNTASFNRNDLSFGTHQITVTIDDGFSEHEAVEETLQLTITNDAPSIDITQPSNGDSFCADELINFKSTVIDLNTVPGFTLPDESVSWHVTNLSGDNFTSIGTGKDVDYAFVSGGFLVTARATDEEGLTDEQTIELSIDGCSDNPPSVTIVDPATDSGTSDNQYVYNGFDDVRAQWYTDVSVTGSASDNEDGALSGVALVWSTDQTGIQDSILATGTNATVRLYSDSCFGVWHEVTLTATDSDANERSQTVRIYIWTLC
ncbi:MAG: DUF5011 domain-containing protein [Kangiellaceae bacterium]|nr:DUF5011 domain-containing protein [Kangiellaceae bacterium]